MLFPVMALALLAMVWGSTFSLIRVERQAALRAALSSTSELAETYEAQAVRAFREIDLNMKIVKFAYVRDGHVDLDDLRTRNLLLSDLVFAVSVADADGRIIMSNSRTALTHVKDEPYFEAQKAVDRFMVSLPQQDVDGEWKLHFSRRLSGADGAFRGIVIVSVAASYFASGYESARLGEKGVLAIAGNDGIIRVRRTGDRVYRGETIRGAEIATLVNAAEPVSLASSWDGEIRFATARQLFDYPVTVVVGLSQEEYHRPVLERAHAYQWRAAAGTVVILIGICGLGVLSWKLSRVRANASRVLKAIESSVNAILITNLTKPDYPVEYVNPAFERITGYATHEVVGRNARFLMGDDIDQAGYQEIRQAILERREGHAVLRNYRKDGSRFWNDLTIAPVRNDRGEVTHCVEVMNDVTAAKTYEEQLAHQANFDALTGLANRNLLQDRLQQAIAGARREGGVIATLFLDIDNFKVINDTLGHRIGDELLQHVANRLTACVRESDTVSRLGGDEFVLVIRASGEELSRFEGAFIATVDKVRQNVGAPVVLGQHTIRPACSVGISLFPQDGNDADTLLRHADAAMYRAKELGRNRFQFFTADVQARIQKRLELNSSLRLALERREFELHYQPQASLETGKIMGIEALLRWRHPDKGLLGPGEFIAFAEESGLIIPIGDWVLMEACRQNKAWQEAGLAMLPVSVNISARQCEHEGMEASIGKALSASGLDARYLELEITESISMEHPEASVPLMTRLKETGVEIAIDDFGTGFSNLSYLRQFPIDRLKIDLSFVRDMVEDTGSLAIVKAIIMMAHNLDLSVIAEGVETRAQLELLRNHGCDAVQGYYFSKPLAVAAFSKFLSAGRLMPLPRGIRRVPSSQIPAIGGMRPR